MDTNVYVCTCTVIKDLELKYVGAKNTAICNFTVAIDGYKTSIYMDVEIWGEQAEKIMESAKKGSKLNLWGRLKQDVWEDKETGKPKKKLILSIDNYSFVGGKKE